SLGAGVRRQLGIGLFELGVKLVAFDAAQMAVREMIVTVDRIPHRFEMARAEIVTLARIFRAKDIEQSDRRTRLDIVRERRLAIARVVGRGIFPTALCDYQHAEPK